MTTQVSTGFLQMRNEGSPFAEIFGDGAINIYSGTQPASADASVTGTLLARITTSGLSWAHGFPTGGLQFVAGGRYATKEPTDTWRMMGSGTGTAGWFRLVGNPEDDGLASTTLPRIDGSIDTVGAPGSQAQMFLVDRAIIPSTSLVVPSWWYGIPPL